MFREAELKAAWQDSILCTYTLFSVYVKNGSSCRLFVDGRVGRFSFGGISSYVDICPAAAREMNVSASTTPVRGGRGRSI